MVACENAGVFPMFTVNIERGRIAGIDNEKLAAELVVNSVRVVNDPTHTQFEDTLFDTEAPETAKLLAQIQKMAGERGYVDIGSWSQVHQPLESTDWHVHRDGGTPIELSWVYYVKTPEGAGSIVFSLDLHDQRAPTAAISPKAGEYIIFPSYLWHKVTKNLSSDTRIAIAGNFVPINMG
jgi:hypothetical protein